MPVAADTTVKPRSATKRTAAPLTTEKRAPAPLSAPSLATSSSTPAIETATDSSKAPVAPSPSSSTVSPSHTKEKAKKAKAKKSPSAVREGSAETAVTPSPPTTTTTTTTIAVVEVKPLPLPRSPSASAQADTDQDQQELAEGLARSLERRSVPPPPISDADSDSGDALDDASSSSNRSPSATQNGARRDGSVRRAPELVTSLAGKRHTKVVMNPPSSASYAAANNFLGGGSSGNGSAGGQPNSRLFGASGRRGGPAAGLGSAGATSSGGHHHGDATLRYRTDLDKQVIHFMFERYHQEQICSTASAAGVGGGAPSSPSVGAELTEATTAAGTDYAGGKQTANVSSSLTSTQFAQQQQQQQRGRRNAVEEIYVPANGEGEDKNIGLGDWHFFWMHVGRVRHTICSSDFRWQDQQIINHFPDHAELTRKDLMYKNIKRYLRENQANNYAKLTLHTAADWVAAAANANSAENGNAHHNSTSSSGMNSLNTKSFCFADSVPITYNIPNDMSMFKEECQKRRGTQWIVKPTSRSQGKGIFIIDDVRSLQRWVKEKKDSGNMASFLATGPANRASWVAPSVLQQQRAAQQSQLEAAVASNTNGTATTAAGNATHASGAPSSPTTAAVVSPTTPGPNSTTAGSLGAYIVSRYISNPLLIGGKKFDLRLYVLVTSYKPLVAYLHEDGFARFCATRYNGSSLAQEDLGSHLTNVALQKGDEHYNTSHGGKWSFQNLFLYVQGRYGAYAAEVMMRNIQFLIFHSLKAVEPVMFNDKHCFELYGYDILIDDQINPHLIEVNASPSMSTTTVSDRLLKEQVLTDTMKILFPPGYPSSSKAMPYWEYRQRTDLTTQQQTGFKLLQF